MSRYILSERAQEDIDALWEYIAASNIRAADEILVALEAAFKRLAEHPEIGHARPDLTDRDLRFFTVDRMTIVYRPARRPVEIARVISRGRDLGEHLP